MTPILRPIVARINGLTAEIKRTKASTKINHAQKQYVLAILKTEARYTMLSYAFIRRVPYLVVEGSCNEKPVVLQLARTITSFGVSRKQTSANGRTWYWTEGGCSGAWLERKQNELEQEINEWLTPPLPAAQLPKLQKNGTAFQSAVEGVKSLLGLS